MARVLNHLLAATALVAAAASEEYALQPRHPEPQVLPALGPAIKPIGSTVNAPGAVVGTSVVPVVGGVLGVLDVTVQSVADVVTPIAQSLLTDVPLTVLDGLLKAVLQPHPRDPNYHGWQYWGCYYSTTYLSTRTPKTTNSADGMSPKLCISLCVADGPELAIVINDKCYCSDDKPTYDAGSDKCTTPCPLNLVCLLAFTCAAD